MWQLTGSARWSGPQDDVAAAIRDALHLSGDVPYNTTTVEVIAGGTRGKLTNNTFPTDRWIYDLTGERSEIGVERGLEAAIMATLVALRLAPVEAPPRQTVVLDEARFGRGSLDASVDPDAWAEDLGRALTTRLQSATDPAVEVSIAVEDLKLLGHDLWSFDEADEFAIWTYDYRTPPRGRRLTIEFFYAAYEPPTVRVTVQGLRDAV